MLRAMKIAMSAAHALDLSALRKRVDQRVAFYNQKYPQVGLGQYYRWTDTSHATAEYKGGKAQVELGARDVSVVLELPFFARLYQRRIEDFVRNELEALTRPEA